MITEGWYIPAASPTGRRRYNRWVLGEIEGMIRYSKGGAQHFMCKTETFQKWVRRYEAKLARGRDQLSGES